jgi:tetratricopeptide (TPR) repeat protein
VVEALRAGWLDRPGERGPLTPRVQAVIEARLAQLSPPARELAGVAAAIGREFTTDVLAQASQADEETLVGGLDELWRRRIARDHGPDAYDFTHDRIREVAYAALGPARRRHTHRRVADALERLHAGDPDPVAAQVAAHHDRAGEAEAAITWYERGAAVAQRLGANAEAARLLDRALELVRAQPRVRARQERELALVTRLQAPLGVAEGWASERLAEAQRRGLELADGLGVEPAAPLLLSMGVASLVRGDFGGAQRVGERLRAGGMDAGDDLRRVEGEYMLGIASFWRGEFAAARRRFEAAVDRYRPEQRPTHLLRFGMDLEVVCASRLGNTLWFLGHPEAATRAAGAALALAEEVGHPFSRATALVFAAMLAVDLGDPAAVQAHTAALFALPGGPRAADPGSGRRPAGVCGGPRGPGGRRHRPDPAGPRRPGRGRARPRHARLRRPRAPGGAPDRRRRRGRPGRGRPDPRRHRQRPHLGGGGPPAPRRVPGRPRRPADQVTAELERAVGTARRQGRRCWRRGPATACAGTGAPATGHSPGRERSPERSRNAPAILRRSRPQGGQMIAVMGAAGNVGGKVTELLREGRAVRVLEHRRRLDGLGERGAEIVTGDAVDPDDLGRLLEGAEAALVLLPEDLTDPAFVANRSRMSEAIAEALAGSRVGQVVALSTVGAGRADAVGPRPGCASSSSGWPGSRTATCCRCGRRSTWRTCWPPCR